MTHFPDAPGGTSGGNGGAAGGPPGDTPPVRRIVVGVDGSPGSRVALEWAVREAAARGVALHLVCSWDVDDTAAGTGDSEEVAANRVQEGIRSILSLPGQPPRTIGSTPRGEAGRVLVEAARGAELLVLGTTYLETKRSPGPVSLYCLQHAHGPVVFVPALPAGAD